MPIPVPQSDNKNAHRIGIESLPVEIHYELQLYALSQALPLTSVHVYRVYKEAPPSFHAQYILGRILADHSRGTADIISKALRYPLCSVAVLEAICRSIPSLSASFPAAELPKRIFRSLTPNVGWKEYDPPIPFLTHLYNCSQISPPDINSHEGYALTKAVYAGFIPLIRFLLAHGASPACKDGLAVMVGIRRKDVSLVRMLVERGNEDTGNCRAIKKRKLEDRVKVNTDMLKTAVKCGAKEIVEYFTQEKGCIPDMQTLYMMTR